MDGTTSSLIAAFREKFDGGTTPAVYRAPGRVNLIGEHTDYSLGFVCPVALDLSCHVAAAPNDRDHLRIYSRNVDESREVAISDLGAILPSGDWTDYVFGVAVQLAQSGFEVPALDLYIDSTVPQGGGLSSSASLEVATALALLGDWKMNKTDLAKLARSAEVDFVGMPCGIMDQCISVFGQEQAALKIDCRSLDLEVITLPESVEIVAVNTMVKHELGASAYRDRVAECRLASEAIGVECLRDARMDQLDLVPDRVAFRRARHVIGENARVGEFQAAAAAGNVWEMGRLFVASHHSLQHDYEVSCAELDYLVDVAVSLPYVYGARMTGGGFGGCTVNIMKPGTSGQFEARIYGAYKELFGLEPVFYPVRPSAGAGRVV